MYDLSATPFYLGGSGCQEGYIFPWVVSDFSLMDAIESGIVKIPRVPVDDDVAATDQPTYLRLWDHIGDELPKRANRKVESDSAWVPPKGHCCIKPTRGCLWFSNASFCHLTCIELYQKGLSVDISAVSP